MSIYNNLMLGSLLDCVEIVVVHPLTVVILSTRDNIANITTLKRCVSILIHQLISSVHVTLIVANR